MMSPSTRWLLPLLLAVAASARAQDPGTAVPAARAAGPHVKVSVDHFDFGTVSPGETVSGQVVIESVGDAALDLTRIGVQCECAQLHLSTATKLNVPIEGNDEGATALTLKPGESATLDLSVDTTKLREGSFSKRCLIFCSDKDKSPLSIPFTLEIAKRKAPVVVPTDNAKDGRQGSHPVPGRPVQPSDDEDHAAPPAPITTSGPPGKIEADEYKHGFGEVFRGETLHHTFQLKNTGPGDLTLQEIRNSCSCAAAKLKIGDKTLTQDEIKHSKLLGVLKPGESAQLEIELKTAAAGSAGRDVPITKLVRVFSSDPTLYPMVLTLEAMLTAPFTMEPERLDFGAVRHGQGGHASVVIASSKLGDFDIEDVHSPNTEIVKVRFEKIADAAVPSYKIEADLLPGAPLGTYMNHVDVLVRHERVKELNIPLFAAVEPNVSFHARTRAGSDRLEFGMLDPDQDATQELEIENSDPKVPYIPKSVTVEAKPSSEAFTTEIVEVEKGMKYIVKLTAPKSLAAAHFFQGALEITADHPDVPSKKIIFRGWYKRNGKQ